MVPRHRRSASKRAHLRVLLTGFEPFDGSSVNPSAEVVAALANEPLDGASVVPLVLPVVGGVATRRLLRAIDAESPDAVIMLGESSRAAAITLERVAVNLRDYRIADNAGAVVRDQPVVRGGPAAYFSALPVRDLLEAVTAEGIACDLSLSAGSFLCNEVMYAALHDAATRAPRRPTGFVHLPRLPRQVGRDGRQPSMPIEAQVHGVAVILETLAATTPRVSPRGEAQTSRARATKGRRAGAGRRTKR
ncbi:MAG: pyroglutamyl-peptidase I [Phycisphaerales bacterium]